MAETVALNLRLPVELHRRLKEAAESDHRSLNNLIILLLEQGLKGTK